MNAGPNPSHPAPRHPLTRSREAILTAAVFLLLGLFAITAFASRMYHKTVHVLADQWSAAGESASGAKNFPEAITDYRNALIYSPNNSTFQFRLAKALSAEGHGDQAETYLLSLLSESPGSGPVNLELARIAAHHPHDMSDAFRYYHAAIYGVWDADPLITRSEVRRELCEFLLARSATRLAEPELIALADNVPQNDVARTKVASNLLLRGQLYSRALVAFQSALDADPEDSESLSGAATAAFHLAKYPEAVNFLQKIPADQLTSSQSDMLETAHRVIALDPFGVTLSAASRAAITVHDLDLAKSHAGNCSVQGGDSLDPKVPPSDLEKLIAQKEANRSMWSERMLVRAPDRINEAMALAFQMENAVAAACGPLSGPDRALWLLGSARAASSVMPSSSDMGARR